MRQKNHPQEAPQSTKIVRAILFAIFSITFLPMVSAMEWDNCGQYDPETRTMTIVNAFCLGETIAKITLLSPDEVRVFPGEERLVAWYKIENFQEYDGRDVFGVIDTYNLNRGGTSINKNFKFKKENEEESYIRTSPVYEPFCSQILNENGTLSNVCNNVHVRNEEEYVRAWRAFNKNNLLGVGTHTIGLFTEVGEGERVDWVPEMYGVRINEWALWTTSLTTGLLGYWKLDESTGSNAKESVFGVQNGTLINMENGDWIPGIINNGLSFDGVDEIVRINESCKVSSAFYPPWNLSTTNQGSLSVWINTSAIPTSEDRYFQHGFSAIFNIKFSTIGARGFTASLFDGVAAQLAISGVTPVTGNWYHVVSTFNESDVMIYVNGSLKAKTAIGTINYIGNGNLLGISGHTCSTTAALIPNATMDEAGFWNRTLTASEISDLYNEGSGISFSLPGEILITVTLNSPEDASKINVNFLNFQADFGLAGEGNFTNATLHLWNTDNSLFATNFTNVTGVTNSSNLSLSGFSIGGGFQWNYLVCGENSTGAPTCVFAANNRTFNRFGFTENSQTFNNETLEGSSEAFSINLTYNNTVFPVIASNLIYNGVSFAGTQSGIGSTVEFNAQANIPAVSQDTNLTFHWEIGLFDGSTTETANSTFNNQTVKAFNVDNCTSNTNKILNFSVVDEEFQTSLLATIEIAVNLFSVDRRILIANFSASANSTSTAICFNTNLLNDTVFVLDTIVKYSAEDHVIEYYNIVNFILTNNTLAQNITLFDLNSSDSTEFRISFTDNNFLPAAGALVFLDRQYIAENTFKTVELPITDPNGRTILHIVRNDVVYNIRLVSAGGIVIGNFQEITFFCEDPLLQNCQTSLSSTSNVSATFNYNQLTGLAFPSPPTFNNNTNLVSFDFVVPGGGVRTVTMDVTRNDVFGNRTICQNTLVSTSGTLSCLVDPGISDTTLRVTISVNGNTILISSIDIDSNSLGSIGYVVWFILTKY